jgi:hypothetical protein
MVDRNLLKADDLSRPTQAHSNRACMLCAYSQGVHVSLHETLILGAGVHALPGAHVQPTLSLRSLFVGCTPVYLQRPPKMCSTHFLRVVETLPRRSR